MIAIALTLATRALGAQSQEITITSREIVERLTRLDDGQKNLSQRMDDLNHRIDDLNRRIDDLRQTTLWGFGVTFSGLFILMGFVIWDRRTAISPVMRRTEQIEAVLREYAAKSPELAEALRKAKLL